MQNYGKCMNPVPPSLKNLLKILLKRWGKPLENRLKTLWKTLHSGPARAGPDFPPKTGFFPAFIRTFPIDFRPFRDKKIRLPKIFHSLFINLQEIPFCHFCFRDLSINGNVDKNVKKPCTYVRNGTAKQNVKYFSTFSTDYHTTHVLFFCSKKEKNQ